MCHKNRWPDVTSAPYQTIRYQTCDLYIVKKYGKNRIIHNTIPDIN